MAVWFIGVERAKELLDYALARLATQGHVLEPKAYFLIRKFLEARIPLWVEERRGPLDRQGKPLLSEDGYKDFIKWWVSELVKNQTAAIKEEPVSRHYAEEIFGSKQRMAGASVARRPLRAGVIEDLNAEVFNIGPKTAAAYKAHVADRLNAYVTPFANGNWAKADTVTGPIQAKFDVMIDGWERDEGRSPIDPLSGRPFAETYKSDLDEDYSQREQVYRALDEMVYEAFSMAVNAGSLGFFGAYGQTAPPMSGLTGPMSSLGITANTFASKFSKPSYSPTSPARWSLDAYQEIPFPAGDNNAVYASGSSTFLRQYTYGDNLLFASFISTKAAGVITGLSLMSAIDRVDELLESWPQTGSVVEIGANDTRTPAGETAYSSLKATFEAWAKTQLGI